MICQFRLVLCAHMHVPEATIHKGHFRRHMHQISKACEFTGMRGISISLSRFISFFAGSRVVQRSQKAGESFGQVPCLRILSSVLMAAQTFCCYIHVVVLLIGTLNGISVLVIPCDQLPHSHRTSICRNATQPHKCALSHNAAEICESGTTSECARRSAGYAHRSLSCAFSPLGP